MVHEANHSPKNRAIAQERNFVASTAHCQQRWKGQASPQTMGYSRLRATKKTRRSCLQYHVGLQHVMTRPAEIRRRQQAVATVAFSASSALALVLAVKLENRWLSSCACLAHCSLLLPCRKHSKRAVLLVIQAQVVAGAHGSV